MIPSKDSPDCVYCIITPACATVTSMAQLYDKDAAYASSLYVLTTLL